MQMPDGARAEETVAQSYPIIIRSFEPVPSLPPLEELSAQGPCFRRSATPVTSDLAQPSLGMGSGDRYRDAEDSSRASEKGDA